MRARGREVYIIAAVVAVVLIVAWYFLLLSPTLSKVSDTNAQIVSAQAALASAQANVVRLESYKKTAPQSREEIVRLGKMLPTSEGIPSLIMELTKTASASGVDLASITRGSSQTGSPFGIQTVQLTVNGSLLRCGGLPVPHGELRRFPQRGVPGLRAGCSKSRRLR